MVAGEARHIIILLSKSML